MRRTAAPARSATAVALDLACLTRRDGTLALLVHQAGGCPWAPWDGTGSLEAAAARLAKAALGRVPVWRAQIGAFADGSAHPSHATLTIAYVAIAREGTPAPTGARWLAVDTIDTLPARQRTMLAAALRVVRERMDQDGLAFHLLPERFTLGELQATYELLLGRRLHKASFRRTLAATGLVEATNKWRSEGRGRPAREYVKG